MTERIPEPELGLTDGGELPPDAAGDDSEDESTNLVPHDAAESDGGD